MYNKGIENIICKKKRFNFEALFSTANIRGLVQLTWSVIPDMVLLRQKSTYPFFLLAYDGVIIDVPLAMQCVTLRVLSAFESFRPYRKVLSIS